MTARAALTTRKMAGLNTRAKAKKKPRSDVRRSVVLRTPHGFTRNVRQRRKKPRAPGKFTTKSWCTLPIF
eukprot:4014405-Prymnesium_polylepis.1